MGECVRADAHGRHGDYVYPDEHEHTPRFPNRELLITRLPGSGEVFGLECLGEYFPPSAELPPFSKETYESDSVPEDGAILPGPLSRYATSVG